MKKEIGFSDAVGKTIEGYAFSIINGQAVIAFTDETFATLGIDLGYEAGEEEIKEDSLDLHGFGDSTLDSCGIITHKELSEVRVKISADLAAKQERVEKFEYERLRRKYEMI